MIEKLQKIESRQIESMPDGPVKQLKLKVLKATQLNIQRKREKEEVARNAAIAHEMSIPVRPAGSTAAKQVASTEAEASFRRDDFLVESSALSMEQLSSAEAYPEAVRGMDQLNAQGGGQGEPQGNENSDADTRESRYHVLQYQINAEQMSKLKEKKVGAPPKFLRPINRTLIERWSGA